MPPSAPTEAGSGRGSLWGSQPTRRAAQGARGPLGPSNAGQATSWEAKEPKAPHAPAGRVEASPERASVAAGAQPPPLDTLAQPCQKPDGDAKGTLVKRARAKYFSLPLAVRLAELRSPLELSYRNTVYCAGRLDQDESGTLRGKYCGARWCMVCNRVRTARSINRYMPELSRWHHAHFVTLTIPNVCRTMLPSTIQRMLKVITSTGRAIRRTDGLPFRALRKLECTYNRRRDDYHPHFHIVVADKAQAEALVRRWLRAWPHAMREAQDIRATDPGSLFELFKYFTKLLTRLPGSCPEPIAPANLDVIFRAMKGRRVFQPMGFRIHCDAKDDEDATIGTDGNTVSPVRYGEAVRWEWHQPFHDWIDGRTGVALTGYVPSDAIAKAIAALTAPGKGASRLEGRKKSASFCYRERLLLRRQLRGNVHHSRTPRGAIAPP